MYTCLLFRLFINISSGNMAAKAKRDQIVALKTAGKSNCDITKQLDVCRKTVYNIWKQYTETATTSSKPIPGRKRSIRTKAIVQAVMKRVKRNPRRSMRKTASQLGISRSSMHRIFKNDLGLTAYKKQPRQLLSAASKQKRHDRGKMMLAEMQRAVDNVFIWSDEKIFTVEAVTNTQNDRLYAHNAEDLPEGSRTHFRRMKPAGVMVWAAVASDGSKSPLIFIKEGVKVNTQLYIKMLAENVLPWITKSFGNSYVFTQDGAPSHTSNLTQQWCNDHFSGFWDKTVWPPSSPDINPMDFCIWSILESDVSAKSYTSVPALKDALLASWSALDEEVVRRSCDSVTRRLELMVKAKGGHFEM